jgi:hypothetical protein
MNLKPVFMKKQNPTLAFPLKVLGLCCCIISIKTLNLEQSVTRIGDCRLSH